MWVLYILGYYAAPVFTTALKLPEIKIIKVVTFNMNPMFIKVILNSFIFAMATFCTGPTEKFGIIGINKSSGQFMFTAATLMKSNRQLTS